MGKNRFRRVRDQREQIEAKAKACWQLHAPKKSKNYFSSKDSNSASAIFPGIPHLRASIVLQHDIQVSLRNFQPVFLFQKQAGGTQNIIQHAHRRMDRCSITQGNLAVYSLTCLGLNNSNASIVTRPPGECATHKRDNNSSLATHAPTCSAISPRQIHLVLPQRLPTLPANENLSLHGCLNKNTQHRKSLWHSN